MSDPQAKELQQAKKKRRLLAIVALVVAGAAFSFLAFGNAGDNLVYYWSPTELQAAGDDAIGASVRLGGLVAEDSVVYGDDGVTLSFSVTDGETTLPVVAESVPPAMFREGIGVVIEGTLKEGGNFETKRLMVKHDNQYQAPETKDERSVEELMKSMQFDT